MRMENSAYHAPVSRRILRLGFNDLLLGMVDLPSCTIELGTWENGRLVYPFTMGAKYCLGSHITFESD